MNPERMSKKFNYIDHLSDAGIEFYGDTLKELFENAAAGMFSIMHDLKKLKPQIKKKVKISGKNIVYEDLLILWLEKLLYLYEVDEILFSDFKVSRIEISGNTFMLEADIYGEKIDLSRHKIRNAIKAPTYQELKIKEDGKNYGWKGRVIFDV